MMDRETEPNRRFRGVNLAILEGGREVHVDDITDEVEGQKILDEIEGAAITIEGQLETDRNDPDWRRKATTALKRKRAVQTRIQRRLGEIRRANRLAAAAVHRVSEAARIDVKRRAFILAAVELLGHEACTEIWARAQEMKPDAFVDERDAA